MLSVAYTIKIIHQRCYLAGYLTRSLELTKPVVYYVCGRHLLPAHKNTHIIYILVIYAPPQKKKCVAFMYFCLTAVI